MNLPIDFQPSGGDLLVCERPELKTLYTPRQLQFHFQTLAKRLVLAGNCKPAVCRYYSTSQILDWARSRAKNKSTSII